MPQTITLAELIGYIGKAKQRMSSKNPHRLLLMQCEDALIQLATRVGELSAGQESTDGATDPHAVGSSTQ